MVQQVITEEVRAWIGRRFDPITYEVEPSGIRLFARAMGYTDPIYYDAGEARRRGHRDPVAPFGYLGAPVYNPALRLADPPRLPELPLRRRLNGGTVLGYFQDVCAGDVLTAITSLKNIYERTGSAGPMVFIVLETEFLDGQGKLVARQETTLIRY